MTGTGVPDAVAENVTLLPTVTFGVVGDTMTTGVTAGVVTVVVSGSGGVVVPHPAIAAAKAAAIGSFQFEISM